MSQSHTGACSPAVSDLWPPCPALYSDIGAKERINNLKGKESIVDGLWSSTVETYVCEYDPTHAHTHIDTDEELLEHLRTNFQPSSSVLLACRAAIPHFPSLALCVYLPSVSNFSSALCSVSLAEVRALSSMSEPLVGFGTTLFLSCSSSLCLHLLSFPSLRTTEAPISPYLCMRQFCERGIDRQTGDGGKQRDEWSHSRAQPTKTHTDTSPAHNTQSLSIITALLMKLLWPSYLVNCGEDQIWNP